MLLIIDAGIVAQRAVLWNTALNAMRQMSVSSVIRAI